MTATRLGEWMPTVASLESKPWMEAARYIPQNETFAPHSGLAHGACVPL